jgi:hypothetical protein
MADSALLDPLGRRIVLADATWYGHILRRHPDLRAHRRFVEQVVAAPDVIRVSQSDADCRLYYCPGPRPGVSMSVVANVVVGQVLTAHPVKKVSGGAVEWSRPNP